MKNSSIAILFVFTIACNMPKAEPAIMKMDKYWRFYMAENYDSLKTFYYLENASSSEEVTPYITVLKRLRENYGNINKADLVEQSTIRSTEGSKVELTYDVDFNKKVVKNKFTFIINEKGEYKIVGHSFTE